MAFSLHQRPTVSDPAPSTSATGGRFIFLDGLRGVALILMVVNHTSRWWMDVSMGWWRYYLVYGSMTLPGPIFLFLVGFCLPISFRRERATARPALRALGKYVGRGLQIILAGLLLNVLVFPEDPVWGGGVLQTIGLSIIVLAPALWILHHRAARWALLALAALIYLSFAWLFDDLVGWLPNHPTVAQIWFLDFPPWPWISAALIGLVAGWVWLDAPSGRAGAEARYFWVAAAFGLACLVGYFAWDSWMQTSPRISFKRDFMLNRHWTPRGATNLLIVGGVACLLSLAYWVMEVKRRRLGWFVILGETAFMLYFVHQLIVLTLANQALGMRFNHWGLYWLANVVLMVALVYLGKAWLAIKRATRQLSLVRRGVPPGTPPRP